MKILFYFLCAVTVVGVGYWYVESGKVVAQTEQSIVHWRKEFQARQPNIRIQYDDISRAGFPFSPAARIGQPTLSTVSGNESFAVGFETVTLVRIGAGSYRVETPDSARAVYAVTGEAPEEYLIGWSVAPKLYVRTKTADAPFAEYGVQLPQSLLLIPTLNGASEKIAFNFSPLLTVRPIYAPIPQEVAYPLQIFVGMLREALVFKGRL